ncbi:MAG: hypothetical protein K8T25_02360 [Planctomycetia bacterium]|nr:hypothetical protein [Planctomycetia bacterium]
MNQLSNVSIIALVCLSVVAIAFAVMTALRFSRRRAVAMDRATMVAAREAFHRQREHLEARFLTLADASGKPRGLRWVNCDFRDEISYARDCDDGTLTALVGVTISFEAIEGGGMEEVEAVSNLRAATAVFQYDHGQWTTQGRAIMNLEPLEAIQHFRGKLALIAE